MKVVVERVIRKGRECNDNNNDKDEDDLEAQDLDYVEYVSRTWLHRYADLIGYPYVFEYRLHEAEVYYLKEAIPSGFLTGKPCTQLEEELSTITERLRLAMPPTPPNGWFVRMSSGSPKDGMKRRALMDARDIVNQLSTSKRALIGLHTGDRRLYLVPFDPDWEDFRELRVFIRKGRVTAISQYDLCNPSLFTAMSDTELTELALNLTTYLHTVLPPILEAVETQDVVCDLYYNPDETFKIIEFNSFGYFSSAGASLFHWQNDRSILYGAAPDTVYFRVHA